MCWIFHETLSIWLPIRCPLKKIVYASWKVLKICLRASKRWLILTNSVRCFDHCGDVLICLLINTNAPSHWLKSVAWPVGPVLKFRDIPDCLKVIKRILKVMRSSIGNWCISCNTGEKCSCLSEGERILAATFWTCWSILIVCFGCPYGSEIQKSNLEVMKACTSISAVWRLIYFFMRLMFRRG